MTINNIKLLLSDEQQMIIIRLQFSPALRNIFALFLQLATVAYHRQCFPAAGS